MYELILETFFNRLLFQFDDYSEMLDFAEKAIEKNVESSRLKVTYYKIEETNY